MDSRPPPSPSQSSARSRLRPWYLVVAMVFTWLIGVQGITGGCAAMSVVREGHLPDTDAALAETEKAEPMRRLAAVAETARIRATTEHGKMTFPLGAARMLLGALLVVASGLALAGRPGGRGLAIQAALAFAAIVVVDYALTRAVREAWIRAVLEASYALPETVRERSLVVRSEFWWWVARFRILVLDLTGLLFALFALTRARTIAFFKATERAEGRPSSP